jgi:hypothetical protein
MTTQADEETGLEQMQRLRRELAELKARVPLSAPDQDEMLRVLDEMDEVREWLDATLRAHRLPPLRDGEDHLN